MCLGLENEDKTQKETASKTERDSPEPCSCHSCPNRSPMLQACSDLNKSNLGPSCPTVSATAPSLYPLKPCSSENTASVTLGCLVKDYFPDPVTVTWYSDSLNTSTMNFPSVGSDLKTTTSQMTSWGKSAKNFTCHVTHAPSKFVSDLTIRGKQG